MRGGLFERPAGVNPPAFTPGYKTSVLRSPRHTLVSFNSTPSEDTGPAFGHMRVGEADNDLLINYAQPGETAIGERIILHGKVLDESGRPIPNALVEIWQANAGGRYRHKKDSYLAALDPNFGGCGRTLTDEDGHYWFRTVKPGAYPWPNGPNEWRPAHIHLSIFGYAFGQRLITQLYFEGDPLIPRCPILGTIPDADARDRLVAALDIQQTKPMDAIAYRFDVVLRGSRATHFENRPEGL
ncbi:protocatechuate 3,4-dioxygenase subunit beta [Qingshengfaniella alkalisoli]|uniref:Protocatechuate 3,4-dioxygenase subunit beta n=1 Tax=Qingshengfaniella alkalisoli TaxID=2599296 RepID=A0A5B8IWZ9_9RHOB|nr:protocatechuate 3,4-dioxygenase subunit beta [Qingshengfaniella alkalisoli]QDY69088.1 protocatechuate 3,4-dioxygenase subunit beta [Qingshengfaniella alkalisoli]